MVNEVRVSAPITHDDQDAAKGQQLADFHAQVEGDQVADEAVGRKFEFEDFGGKAKTMKKAEDQRRRFGIGLKAEPPPEGAQVVEGFVDDGEPDDGIDQVGVNASFGEHAKEQGGRVADRKKCDVDGDVFEAVEEEDDAEEEKQVVVTGDHVFGTEVDEGGKKQSAAFLDIPLVATGNPMGPSANGGQEQKAGDRKQKPAGRRCSREDVFRHGLPKSGVRGPARREAAAPRPKPGDSTECQQSLLEARYGCDVSRAKGLFCGNLLIIMKRQTVFWILATAMAPIVAAQMIIDRVVDLPIPDDSCIDMELGRGEGGVSDVVMIPGWIRPDSMWVEVQIDHSFRWDLQVGLAASATPVLRQEAPPLFSLAGAASSTARLANAHDFSGDNYYALFDDEAALDCSSMLACGGTANCTGPTGYFRCRPDEPMMQLFTASATPQVLRLQVCDREAGFTGTLRRWRVYLFQLVPVELQSFSVD